MRINLHFFLGMAIGAGVLFLTSNGKVKGEVPVPTATPQPEADRPLDETPTPTPKPTATPTPKPTSTPQPEADRPLDETPTPSASSQQINEFIDKFSSQYGVDPNKVRHTALCESGFNPGAVNGPYMGLFQFDARTWQTYRARMGKDANIALRSDAREAVETAAYVYSVRATGIWPNCQAR